MFRGSPSRLVAHYKQAGKLHLAVHIFCPVPLYVRPESDRHSVADLPTLPYLLKGAPRHSHSAAEMKRYPVVKAVTAQASSPEQEVRRV